MKKVAIMVGLCCGTLFTHSYANTQLSEDVVREKMKQEGFMLEKGVALIAAEKILAPNSLKSLWKVEPSDQNKISNLWQAKQLNAKENNIQAIYSERAEELLQMNAAVSGQGLFNADNTDLNSTILRKNISDINMAYAFNPVPSRDVSKQYGFAACGTFNQGWTGVTEFFQKQALGSCAYTEYNFELAHATAKVEEASAGEDINHKVTTVHVEGTKDSGYVYTVAWMDATFFRTLECANKDYSVDTKAQVIALAQRIDNQ